MDHRNKDIELVSPVNLSIHFNVTFTIFKLNHILVMMLSTVDWTLPFTPLPQEMKVMKSIAHKKINLQGQKELGRKQKRVRVVDAFLEDAKMEAQ